MIGFLAKSLIRKLVAIFLVLALAPIGIVAWLAFRDARAALEADAFETLEAVASLKRSQILAYMEARVRDLTVLAKSRDVKEAFDKLTAFHDSSGATATGPYNVSSEEYAKIFADIDPFFRTYTDAYGYYDIFFLCAAHGHVMYTMAKEQDLGTNLSSGPYRDSGLARLWAEVTKEKRPSMVDYTHYEPSGEPAMFVGSPVLDEKEEVCAVIALQVSTKQIDAIMQATTGMGDTGETYLVGEDLLMRSDSRFEETSTILKQKVETVAARAALEDKSGKGIIDDYRGVSVLSCYSHFGLNEHFDTNFEWAIISEVNEAEAFAAVGALKHRIIWAALLIGLLAALAGYLVARSTAKPIAGVSGLAVKISEGDLTTSVSANGRADEVGVLTAAFGKMAESLRQQVAEIQGGVNTLGASVSEISSSASQLAASAAETASSVTETTTTAEELKQTAQVASEKAGAVSEGAQRAAKASQVGQTAVTETRDGIVRIREQMESVAESVVTLSEKSQDIGAIISSVDDLAEQSNLLAVNAAIEAAKAGEQGKGFAVVAQEIKSLAEQSRQATTEVRTILSDIQKAMSAAVMATEQGTKAVDAGMKQSEDASEAIGHLSTGAQEAAQSAIQIAASSQQQLAGVEQVTAAMESIKQASTQNVDSSRALEEAGRNLTELGNTLKKFAAQYKV